MLAHAADSSSEVKIRLGYPEILMQLSSIEVKLLDEFYSSIKEKLKQNTAISKNEILKVFDVSSAEYDILVGNLFRLGLCERMAPDGGSKISDFPAILGTYNVIRLTPLGIGFIRACKY